MSVLPCPYYCRPGLRWYYCGDDASWPPGDARGADSSQGCQILSKRIDFITKVILSEPGASGRRSGGVPGASGVPTLLSTPTWPCHYTSLLRISEYNSTHTARPSLVSIRLFYVFRSITGPTPRSKVYKYTHTGAAPHFGPDFVSRVYRGNIPAPGGGIRFGPYLASPGGRGSV